MIKEKHTDTHTHTHRYIHKYTYRYIGAYISIWWLHVCMCIYIVHIWNIWKPASTVLFLFRWGTWYLEISQSLSHAREQARPTALFETQVWFSSRAYALSPKSGSEKWHTFSRIAPVAWQASTALETWERHPGWDNTRPVRLWDTGRAVFRVQSSTDPTDVSVMRRAGWLHSTPDPARSRYCLFLPTTLQWMTATDHQRGSGSIITTGRGGDLFSSG